MKLWLLLEKRFLITMAAANAMQALLERQQDISLDTPPETMKKRYTETAQVAVQFAQALWAELSTKNY